MDAHRLRAPAADGSLLAIPPIEELPALLASNAEHLAAWDYDFQGRPASRLRLIAREQVFAKARAFLNDHGLDAPSPSETAALVVTGHQPELFHPGVWVKNFAASAVARASQACALNLIVDNDVPKAPSIRVPHEVEGRLKRVRVAFDRWTADVPFEDLRVEDEGLFDSFADRVRSTLAGSIRDPLIDAFWPLATAARDRTDRVGLRFAIARRTLEASWGVSNLEVPMSAVCETEGFHWFVCHLLAHLPRFQRVHNAALDAYRALYGIRSRNHPVPALGREGDWLEAPFWVWRENRPRRKPLMARQLSRSMQLRVGGEDEPLLEIPLSAEREACCAVDQLQELPMRGIRLRSRALTTTMFARSLLGDLFIHGIGGAKYDELGDTVSARFFGVEPPQYSTISMTLRLGLNGNSDANAQLKRARRTIRDLEWNPDRFLDASTHPAAEQLVRAKVRAVAEPAETPEEKLARFAEIRRCNAALQALVEPQRDAVTEEIPGLRSAVERDAVARSREFSLVLHSRARLQAAFGDVSRRAASAR
jgi:hypothetical protein